MSYYQMMVYGSSSTPIKVQLKKPQSTIAKHKIIRIFRNLAEHMHVTFNNLHDQKSDTMHAISQFKNGNICMRILRAIVGPNGEHGPDSFNKHPGTANIYCLNILPQI